jgi:alkaline phosphatase
VRALEECYEAVSKAFPLFLYFKSQKRVVTRLQTYCVDNQVADSACSATAYLGGVKANIGTIGVMAKVKLNDCKGMRNASNQVTSILKWSQVTTQNKIIYLLAHNAV